MQETDTSTHSPARRRLLRRLLLICAVAAVLLVLALVPPLISVNRLQRRISASISQSLGRPAHLDAVNLNLFPWPGFTLRNLVIDDDPAFSNEPVIRANVVTARLRLASLWRRQVEFSTIDFGTDEYGAGPSINLVRNDNGQWNLESILIQASHVNAAPTGQHRAGPAPRFPYIEASGARVNVKRGTEKLPFSLTDAEFALSLTNPQQWRVHLEGRPVRTDTNAAETGLIRVDGTLNRAPSFADVPLNLTASWQQAPLGDATRVLLGNDAGWRGTLSLTTSITGTLGSVLLDARAQLADLHRDDFSPLQSLNLNLRCTAQSSFVTRNLQDIKCLLPLDPANGRQVLLTGTVPDVHKPAASRWQLAVSRVPATWCLDWARLFSQRIPPTLAPAGDVSGLLSFGDHGWTAAFRTQLTQNASDGTPLSLDAALQLGPPPTSAQPAASIRARRPSKLTQPNPIPGPWSLDPETPWVSSPPPNTLLLLPTALHLGKNSQPNLGAEFTLNGYSFHLAGTAAPARVLLFQQLLPPAADTLAALLPTSASTTPEHIDIACSRDWAAPQQTCTSTAAPKPTPRHHHR